MRNYLIETACLDPYENLALEECLMERILPDEAALYLWQNQNTVVIGRNQNAWRECKCDLLEREGGRLARRSSGGGAVFHDLGNLNFTFLASPERYDLARQLSVVLEALKGLGISARFSGRNDLIVPDGRKFSGNAFRHTKTCSLQHGTLLVSVDMDKLGRYLNPSQVKMQAKGVASVRARVCNLRECAPGALSVADVRAALTRAYAALYGPCAALLPADFDPQLLAAKRAAYADWHWRYGLTPAFDVQLETRFAWGGIELLLRLKNGLVAEATVHSDAMDADLPACIAAALRGLPYGAALARALEALTGDKARLRCTQDVARWLAEVL